MSRTKIKAITASQRTAIALLSDGVEKVSIADRVGVSPKTITRWLKEERFAAELQAEIDRRSERARDELASIADETQDAVLGQLRKDMKEFQETLVSLYKARINYGTKMIRKAVKRFEDLPEEAIAMKDIPSLVTTGDRLIESGCNGWAEALGIEELLQTLDNGK